MKKTHRVLFFKPILNWLLGHCYIVIFPVLMGIVFLLFPFIKNFISIFLNEHQISLSTLEENIISGVIATLVPAGITVISIIINGTSRWIKRKIYNICADLYKNAHMPNVFKNAVAYVVNLFYFYNRELIQKQQCIVNDILKSLDNSKDSPKRIYWIQGSPYSGKTTTILNLLVDLISKKEYNHLFQKLDGNIVYFDLGRLDISLQNLQRDYEIEKFSNCLLILDNLHKLSGKSCFHILEKIVLDNHAFALIILLRHPEEFLSGNDRVNDLKNIIKENGTEYVLNALQPHDFEIDQEHEVIAFCRKFFTLEQIKDNSAITIHLYMLYLKSEFDSNNLLPEIQAFLGHSEKHACSISSELSAIIACSLFTGSFNLKLLKKCLPQTSKIKWKKLLDSLTKIGFITNYPNSVKDFYFHEQVAKAYFKVSRNEEEYNNLYIRFFQRLSEEFTDCSATVLQFLYCMMAQDVNKAKKIFARAVTNVNFINLYAEMMFLFNLEVCNTSDYYKEIGILCDRCGKLQEAKNFYSLYMDTEKSADAFYKLVQVNHKSIDKYPAIRLSALSSANQYDYILSNYWEIHVNMHHGIFEFQKLLDLSLELEKNAEIIIEDNLYDGLHLMRRMYFDLFRLYYLEGVFRPEKLKLFTSDNSAIFRILKRELEEFEAYYIKFAVGLMLGQDILFSLAFENKGLDLEKYVFLFGDRIEIAHRSTYDHKAIARETIRIYQQAIEMLDKIGDKTSIFVKYHMYNIKLLLVEDGDFSECERFYEDYMKFADQEQASEYMAYGETFKLKMSLIQLLSPAIIKSYGKDRYDELVNIIRQKLKLVRKYEESAYGKDGNQYSQLRLKLYLELFSYCTKDISQRDFAKEIKKIEETAEKKNYNRELKIIKYIRNYNCELSAESVQTIFSYYPIVPQ